MSPFGRVDSLTFCAMMLSKIYVALTGRAAARVHLIMLVLQVACGLQLNLMQDQSFFLTTQVVVLLHVGSALVWSPFFVLWSVHHGWRAARRRLGGPWSRAISDGLLSTLTLVALGTGFWVILRGEGSVSAAWHRAFGMLIVVPLVWHLLSSARRRLAVNTVAACILALVVLVSLEAALGTKAGALSAEYTFEPRNAELYDNAGWCGSCHQRIHHEWSQSTHGRALRKVVLDEFKHELEERPGNINASMETFSGLQNNHAKTVAEYKKFLVDPCLPCHSPVAFYSGLSNPDLMGSGPVADAVGCGFCHTVRGIHRPDVDAGEEETKRALSAFGHGDFSQLNRLIALSRPFFISAPERVRRYLGQNSEHPLVRQIGDWLIRWRPEVHEQDYHPDVLSTSEMCLPCHGLAPKQKMEIAVHRSYNEWDKFYSRPDVERVDCQDCHMVREFTGRPKQEPNPIVPWGEVRPHAPTHYFAGGKLKNASNDEASGRSKDPEYNKLQRAMYEDSLTLSIESVEKAEGALTAAVSLANRHVGHLFPGHETIQRWAWIELSAYDAGGKLIAKSPRVNNSCCSSEVENIVYYRKAKTESPTELACDSLLAPQQKRVDKQTLRLPKDAPAPRKLVARLMISVAPDAILKAEHSL